MATIPLEIKKDPDFYFRPFFSPYYQNREYTSDPSLPENILVVGCGGGGGYLIPWLARFISQSRSEMIKRINLFVMDGDKVEEKNLIRQNFTADEIGEYKAVALADRCNRALGTNIVPVPSYFTGDVNELPFASVTRHLIIGCVDRHEARKSLCNHLENTACKLYIDVGNSLSSGQVFVSGMVEKAQEDIDSVIEEASEDDEIEVDVRHAFLKMTDIHKDVAKADADNAAPPCVEATASGLQKMGVNIMTSILAFKVFEMALTPDPIPFYEISFGEYGFKTHMLDDLKWTRGGNWSERKPIVRG